MNTNDTKDRIIIMYILIYGSLILSQNVVWDLIQLIPNINNEVPTKTFPVLQSFFASSYVLLSIVLTEDVIILHNIFKKHPSIYRFVSSVTILLFRIVTEIAAFFMRLVELLCLPPNDKVKEMELEIRTKQNIYDAIESFSELSIEVRLYGGLGCLTLILFFISCFIAETYISIIAEVMSLIAALTGCIFVTSNAKSKLKHQ